VSAELVNVRDKSRIWGATIQPQVGKRARDAGRDRDQHLGQPAAAPRSRSEEDPPTKRYTDNVEAYQLYLKGRYVWNKYTEEGWTKAIEYFRQALEIDPNLRAGMSGIADSYYQLSSIVGRAW
jgi:hypothetical protein